jgi:hypothetical protein
MDNEQSAINFFVVRPEWRGSARGLCRTVTESRI